MERTAGSITYREFVQKRIVAADAWGQAIAERMQGRERKIQQIYLSPDAFAAPGRAEGFELRSNWEKVLAANGFAAALHRLMTIGLAEWQLM